MNNDIKNLHYLEYCELTGRQDALVELHNEKNQSYEIFKFTALLMAKKLSFVDILQYMGYTEIYVYGAGEIGHMLLSMLDERIKVRSVIDKSNIEDTQFMQSEIMKNELPIIVTPAAFFQEISYKLIKLGVVRQRIHAIHTILTFAMKYILPKEDADIILPYGQRKHFLITGAQFTNKGAQSMLFTAASEIRKRFKHAIIWYLPLDSQIYTKEIQSRYDFLFLTDGYDLKSQLYEILTELTAIVDVSGYELSSYWNHGGWYLRILRFAYWYGIPLYLMPQSFGPFQFPDELQLELKKYLPKVSHIFARELSAYQQMKDIYGLKNISLSKDLVLQNKKIEKKYIYCRNRNQNHSKRLSTESNVAIIPNERNYEFGSKEKVLELYQNFLLFLLEKGKNIYLISHSGRGDEAVCQNIFEKFKSNPAVHLVVEEMDCMEFEEFTGNFQYIIASRFHAIVHSYKNGVPCIAVGWADKYKELLSEFGQEKYQFDIREKVSKKEIYRAVCDMDMFFKIESEKIQKVLVSIQMENCFDILDEMQE